VLCANEGPLKDLLEGMDATSQLETRTAEIRNQLGRLLVHRQDQLPALPAKVLLIDLADRDVLDPDLIDEALRRIAH
jgi:hypothetical protein